MYTVFRHGAERGTGMGYGDFIVEFESICEDHVQNGKARAFAFIFYNMMDGSIRDALNSERGFEILNNISGKDMTLFYLHFEAVPSYGEKFNQEFLRALNVHEQVTPPCIVFFRANERNIEDIDYRQIDVETQEPHLIIEELRRYVAGYIDGMNKQGDLSGLAWIAKDGLFSILKAALKYA